MKLVFFWLMLACGLDAQMLAPIVGDVHYGSSAYTGPGDIITSNALGWWGLRAYSAATRGTNAVRLCDALDAHCADAITDATTGNLVIPSSNPDCTGSACTIKTWYDQSGALGCTSATACDVTQATIALRPTLTVSCIGSLPCATWTATQGMQSALFDANHAQPYTFSAVFKRTGAFTNAGYALGQDSGAIGLGFDTSADTGLIYAGTYPTNFTLSDSTNHAVQALFNDASSSVYVDGSSTSLSPGVNGLTTANSIAMGVSVFYGLTGITAESGVWTTDKSANFSALNSNQHSYWGF